MKEATLTPHYGELHCPESMLYTDEAGIKQIEVSVSGDALTSESRDEMLCEIDRIIRKYFNVKE